MTFRESIIKYNKLIKRLDLNNPIGNLAADRFSSAHNAPPISTQSIPPISTQSALPISTQSAPPISAQCALPISAHTQTLQNPQNPLVSRRSSINVSSIISPELIYAAQTVSMLAETVFPHVTNAGRHYINEVYTMSPYVFEAIHYIRETGVRLTPLIDMLQSNAVDWGAFGSLAMSAEFILQDFGLDDVAPEKIYAADEHDEVVETIIEIISQPDNWQKKLVAAINKYKDYNPALAWLFIKIITALCIITCNVAGNILAETNTHAQIRETPEANAQIIQNIETNTPVFVIGNVPYYYEIEFQNMETGEYLSGWITKRSVNVIEAPNVDCVLSSTPNNNYF